MEMKVPVRRLVIVFLIVLLVASILVLVLGRHTSLFDFRDNFYLKSTIIYVAIFPAVLLAWLYRSILCLVGLSVLFIGKTLNVVVGIVNRGMFPVSGYSIKDFTTMEKMADYYFLASDSTPLAILGDRAILAGASIGDILMLVGWVSVSIILSWKGAKK